MGHNARKLTQVNKAHKDSSKPNGNSKKSSSKPSLIKINKKKIIDTSKELRVLKTVQQRKHKIKCNIENDYSKRGSNESAPLLCGIFPLFEFDNIDLMLLLLKSTDPDAKITKIDDINNYTKLNSESFLMSSKKLKKNFAFTYCKNFRDRFDYLDLAKVVDWCLFILPNDLEELIGDYTEDLIASLVSQGMPSSCFITLKNAKDFNIKEESKYFESITKISLGEERIQSLNNTNDANKLMRHLSQNCKPSYVSSKNSSILSKSINKKRGYFMIQHMIYVEEDRELKITGCMRGFGVDLTNTQFIHITEVGDLNIKEVQWITPKESNRSIDADKAVNVKKFEVNQIDGVESVKNEGMVDGSSSEESEEGETSSEINEDEEEDEQVSDIGSVDSDNDPNDDKMSFATTAHSGFSVAQIQKFKQSRENSMFPDEVEVAYTEKVCEQFKKYRGVKRFKDAEWPLNENLPDSYGNIFSLKNYKHERNRLCNTINKLDRESINDFIMPGSRLEMTLRNVDVSVNEQIQKIYNNNPDRHFIASNLFKLENCISVLHLNGRRLNNIDDSDLHALAKLKPSNDCTIEFGEEANSHLDNINENYKLQPAAEPIESKETMLFQIGFRRFKSTPIYSEFNATSDLIGNKGKSKYCKFMEFKKDVVATTYGPITFGPVPVLQFRIRQFDLGMEELGNPYIAELVARGSLLSIDPSRPIIKRILLTGEIYKVHKRSVMIRYMFFNTDDINYYKEVPLQTKSNKIGRIIGSHGERGYMRCHFNEPVTQDEIAMMPLYKRVFPKYTVNEMYNYLPNADQLDSGDYNNDAEMMAMDALF